MEVRRVLFRSAYSWQLCLAHRRADLRHVSHHALDPARLSRTSEGRWIMAQHALAPGTGACAFAHLCEPHAKISAHLSPRLSPEQGRRSRMEDRKSAV